MLSFMSCRPTTEMATQDSISTVSPLHKATASTSEALTAMEVTASRSTISPMTRAAASHSVISPTLPTTFLSAADYCF